MWSAIFRLFTITVATLVVTGMALVFVRWTGLRQSYSAPSHPWFSQSQWEFRQPTAKEKCDPSAGVPEQDFAWLKVIYEGEQWRLPCENMNSSVPLSEVLAGSKQKDWLIEVGSIDLGPLDRLIEDLNQFDKNKNFAIYSESQRVARYLRKKSPQWLFAADAASLVRLHLFSAFGIETILEFWPDFVLQFPDDKVTRLSAREVQELERRHKRVIVLPNNTQ